MEKPTAGPGSPGARRDDAGPSPLFRQGPRPPPAVSRRPRAGGVRHGLLLGRRTEVLAGAGRLFDGGRLRRRLYAECDLSRGVQRDDWAHRGRARRVRPKGHVVRRDAENLLGKPRPDTGDAPGERRRHAVPFGDLHLLARAATRRRSVAPGVPGSAERCGLRAHHHRDCRRASVLLRGGLSPAIPREEPRRLLRPRWHGRYLSGRRECVGGSNPYNLAAMSRVSYANTPATLDQEALRVTHGVRIVSAAEEGTGVNSLPGGVYGFTYSPALPNAPLFAERRFRSYETHKVASGEVFVIGFADVASAAALESPGGEKTLGIKPEPGPPANAPGKLPHCSMRRN